MPDFLSPEAFALRIAQELGDDPDLLVSQKALTEELSLKADQEDLNTLASMLGTTVVELAPDWRSIFTRNGSFVFVDDEFGVHRPVGFRVPDYDELLEYNVLTWAANINPKRPSALVKDMTDGSIYVLTLEGDNSITVQGLVDVNYLNENNIVRSDGSLREIRICDTLEAYNAIVPKDPFTLYIVKTV